MINIKKKEECHGCYGCFNICPKKCISMEIDYEGFWYPKVDEKKCINCNLCEKVCPIINLPIRERNETLTFACKNKEEDIRMESSSGGVFTVLCNETIKRGGVVFGAAYDNNFNVYHCSAENISDCSKFRGSKYVQSVIGQTYKEAKKFLDIGRKVLFSGTPCQIAGLDKYLMKKYDNLLLVDIACHGVPSPRVYKDYVNNISKLSDRKIINIQFREKSNGWKDYNFKVTFEDKEFIEKMKNNSYMQGYLKDLYLRPSCYTCKFKKPITSADLTLADYWGVENIHHKFDDDKGVSLILVNTEKGQKEINNIQNKIDIIETDYEYAVKCNPSIVMPVKYNSKKEKFFKELDTRCLNENIRKYTQITIVDKVKWKVKKAIRLILNK